jgi:hypothetical protein
MVATEQVNYDDQVPDDVQVPDDLSGLIGNERTAVTAVHAIRQFVLDEWLRQTRAIVPNSEVMNLCTDVFNRLAGL